MRRTRRQERSSVGSGHRNRTPDVDRTRSGPNRSPVGDIHRAAGNQAVQREQEADDDSRALEPIEDSGEYDVEVPESEMKEAVVKYLRIRDVVPPEGTSLDVEDYVDVTAWESGGAYSRTTATIRVGPDGSLLPTAEYIEENRPEGGYEDGSLVPATRMLQFQINPYAGEYALVLSRMMEVESGEITKQDYIEPEDDLYGRMVGFEESLEKAGIELGEAGSGRVPPEERETTDGGEGSGDIGGSGEIDQSARPGSREAPDSRVQSPEKEQTGTRAPPASTEAGDRSTEYDVREGDTLWDIAEREYGDPQKWPVIYEVEENDIDDPDLIHPGQTLTLPPQSAADAFDRSEYAAPESTGLGKGKL